MIRPYDKSHHSGVRPPSGGDSGKPESEASLPQSDFEQLFQSLYDAAVITDLSGRILHANRRGTDLLLFTCTELATMTIADIITGADVNFLTGLRRNMQGEDATRVQAHCIRKDKSTFPSEVAVSTLHLRKECLVFFIRDITARLWMEEKLKNKD